MTSMDPAPEPHPIPANGNSAPGWPSTPTTPATPSAGHGSNGSRSRRGPAVAVTLALVLAFVAGIAIGGVGRTPGDSPTTADPSGSPQPAFGLIREAWDTLHDRYVRADSLNDRDLIYGAIRGMTEAVGDTGHTSFLTPEQRADRSNGLSGRYVGIGVRIATADDGLPLIIGVFDGSPAETAGLAVGDEIVFVDGQATAGHTIDQIVDWVRGEAGSSVKVTVRPGASGKEREVSMVRADVPVDPVSWTLVPGSRTALIRLEQFSQGAADAFKTVLEQAKTAGAERIVLDLRGNPGGYVNEAEAIASEFLASGVIYIERDAAGKETPHEVTNGGIATDLPLVVLVDGGTASASEIVSGAIQDAGRAQIVGIKTFGTGTVLGEFPLSDGSALSVGTVEWLTPDGRRIWHEGITPDVIVERAADIPPLGPSDIESMTPAEVDKIADPQLARALSLAAKATVDAG